MEKGMKKFLILLVIMSGVASAQPARRTSQGKGPADVLVTPASRQPGLDLGRGWL